MEKEALHSKLQTCFSYSEAGHKCLRAKMSPIQGLKEVQSDSHSPRGLLEKKLIAECNKERQKNRSYFLFLKFTEALYFL